MNMTINPETDALLVIDIQNDFCDGGALAVSGGQAIIPGVADLAKQFKTVILSQDNHPAGHSSFASTHRQSPFSLIQMPYGDQTLWPDHCVQGTQGAQFHDGLHQEGVVESAAAIIRKGTNPLVDSYSAFFENDKATATGLGGLLADRGITRVFCVGLAYDFCVGFSAIDARGLELEAVVVRDLTRSIAMETSVIGRTTVDDIEDAFSRAGVSVIDAGQISTPKDRPSAIGPR